VAGRAVAARIRFGVKFNHEHLWTTIIRVLRTDVAAGIVNAAALAIGGQIRAEIPDLFRVASLTLALDLRPSCAVAVGPHGGPAQGHMQQMFLFRAETTNRGVINICLSKDRLGRIASRYDRNLVEGDGQWPSITWTIASQAFLTPSSDFSVQDAL